MTAGDAPPEPARGGPAGPSGAPLLPPTAAELRIEPDPLARVEDYPPPRALLAAHDLAPKHSWGQNFLGDPGLLQRITETVLPEPGGTVIEIGAGLGHLTARLLRRAGHVVAIERDREMAEVLRRLLGDHPGFELLEDNALTVDYAALATRLGGLGAPAGPPAVAGNLPYQIGSPLLFALLAVGRLLGPWTFLLQREVAERLAAAPSTPEYGALSVHVQLQRRVQVAFPVHRSAFLPPPRVDSLVVRLEPLPSPLVEPGSPLALRVHRLIDDSFWGRRKTIQNSLRARGWEQADRLLAAGGIDASRRAETLTAAEFVRLAEVELAG